MTRNSNLLPESNTELPHNTLADDAPFELHIRDRIIINATENFLKGVRDPYIRERTFLLLRFYLYLMVEVPTAAAYLQENDHGGPHIVFWMLKVAANIRRTS